MTNFHVLIIPTYNNMGHSLFKAADGRPRNYRCTTHPIPSPQTGTVTKGFFSPHFWLFITKENPKHPSPSPFQSQILLT